MRRNRVFVWLCGLAGGGDLSTGLLLLAMPLEVAGWLALPLSSALPAAGMAGGAACVATACAADGAGWLRLIGAFVTAVGASTAYPLLLRRPIQRLFHTAEVAALSRSLVGGYLAVAVAAAALPRPWLTVAVVDLVVAALLIGLRPAEVA